MSDDDLLRAAIVAAPDADLPRLVYADFIQEAGDEAGGEFIRAQVELASTPEYEPFAVRLHALHPDAVTGDARRDLLPKVLGVDWLSQTPYRRGFGWGISVPFLPTLQKAMPILRCREPVQSLALSGGTLPEQLEEFARSSWLPEIREVRFLGLSTPIEFVRMLCSTPAASGLHSLHFDRGDSPAMAILLEAIFNAPVGRGITKLSLRHSTEQSGELLEAMRAANALTELSLLGISMPWYAVAVLVEGGLLGRLQTLRLSGSYLTAGCIEDLAESAQATGLVVLELVNATLRYSAMEALSSSEHLTGLRKLNLNDNPLGNHAARTLAGSRSLGGLRSLLLRQTGTENAGVRAITRGTFWMNLVELDLTRNPIDDRGAAFLLSAPTPPDLTAVRLSINRFSEPMRTALTDKYGFAVRFVPEG